MSRKRERQYKFHSTIDLTQHDHDYVALTRTAQNDQVDTNSLLKEIKARTRGGIPPDRRRHRPTGS